MSILRKKAKKSLRQTGKGKERQMEIDRQLDFDRETRREREKKREREKEKTRKGDRGTV